MTRGRAARRGFTLVETVVTIGVVVALMAIILPGVRTVIEASRSASCQSNLRQLALAAHSYATVHRETYPAAIVYRMTPGGMSTVAWDFEQRPGGGVLPGPLWQHVDTPAEVMQCPSFTGSSTFGHDPATGYNYNTTFIGAEGRFPELGADGRILDGWKVARRGIPAAQHRRPSETALFADAGWSAGANKFMRAPGNTVENDLGMVHSGAQAFRHLGCCNVAHLDGHVAGTESCHRSPHTNPDLELLLGWPRNGFLSEDDSAYDPR